MELLRMTFLKDPEQEIHQVYVHGMGECTVTVQYVHSGNQELIDLVDVVFNNPNCTTYEASPQQKCWGFL